MTCHFAQARFAGVEAGIEVGFHLFDLFTLNAAPAAHWQFLCRLDDDDWLIQQNLLPDQRAAGREHAVFKLKGY